MIDAGERWAYAIGAKPVLTREVERLTVKQRGKAADLEKKIRVLAKSLCAGSLEAKLEDCPDYSFLVDALGQSFNQAQVETMIAPLPDADKLPYMTVAKRQFDFLAAALPRNTARSIAGFESLGVSDPELFDFELSYQIADDPLCVFGFMSQASLLKSQAMAFEAIFPSMYKAIDEAIRNAIVENTMATGEPVIDPFADIGIRVWRGIKIDVVPYQAVYADAGQKKQTAPSHSAAQNSRMAKSNLTPTQRALYEVQG